MAKANVLPVSHIFIHAAAKMYPDLTQPLCLTVWLKKRKEKKKREEREIERRNKLMQRHEEEGKKEARRALQKLRFPLSLVCHSSQIQKVWEAPRMPSKATFC